jgi:hypothetical protein
MLGQGVISLVLTTTLLAPQAARPLSVSLAAQAQAADARLQVRPAAQTDPTPAPSPAPAAEPKTGMSRGKKIAIVLGIVAGAALIWAALDHGDSNNTSGGGGGGGY